MTDAQYDYERGLDEGYYETRKDVLLFLKDTAAEISEKLKPAAEDCGKIHVLYNNICAILEKEATE